MKKLIISALAFVALVGCSKDLSQGVDQYAIEFSTTGEGLSRVTSGKWDANDKVGLFQVLADGTIADDTYRGYANIEYYVPAQSAFESSATFLGSTSMYFHTSSDVDFISYYPYADVQGNLLAVDVSNQSVPKNIDYLYTKLEDQNGSTADGRIQLPFKYVMARLQVVVKCGEGVSSLDGLVVKIDGQSTTANLNLDSGELQDQDNIEVIEAYTNTDGKVYSFLLMPKADALTTTDEMQFFVNGLPTPDFTWDKWEEAVVGQQEANNYLKADKNLILTLTINASKIEGEFNCTIEGLESVEDQDLDAN